MVIKAAHLPRTFQKEKPPPRLKAYFGAVAHLGTHNRSKPVHLPLQQLWDQEASGCASRPSCTAISPGHYNSSRMATTYRPLYVRDDPCNGTVSSTCSSTSRGSFSVVRTDPCKTGPSRRDFIGSSKGPTTWTVIAKSVLRPERTWILDAVRRTGLIQWSSVRQHSRTGLASGLLRLIPLARSE